MPRRRENGRPRSIGNGVRDERAAARRRLDPAFRHELTERGEDRIAMDMQLCRQAAASGQTITWPQPAALNVPGQRACDLQERRERRSRSMSITSSQSRGDTARPF